MSGIKVSDIVYQKALKATIDAVKRGVEGDRSINAGINVIRGSTWFQQQEPDAQKEVESSFRKTMLAEFGIQATAENVDHNPTEVIDYPKQTEKTPPIIPPPAKRTISPTVKTPITTEAPKKVAVESKVQAPLTKPKEEIIRPIRESTVTPSSPPAPVEVPKKKRGMGLGTFIASLVFLGFLAYLSWVLYNHEISIENIVVYEDDKLTFKESFPAEKIVILGQEVEMNYAISRKTSPLKVFRPVSSFPYWERAQDIECNGCDYWTNVENYDLHHYPDK